MIKVLYLKYYLFLAFNACIIISIKSFVLVNNKIHNGNSDSICSMQKYHPSFSRVSFFHNHPTQKEEYTIRTVQNIILQNSNRKFSNKKLFMSKIGNNPKENESMISSTKNNNTAVMSSSIMKVHITKEEEKENNTSNNNDDEYWYNKKIHTLGNIGTLGGLHAAMGPISTILIDKLAYDGRDVRTEVSKTLYKLLSKEEKLNKKINTNTTTRILDMCCGVGMSTRAIQSTFNENNNNNTIILYGIDTSPQMIELARFMTRHDNDLSKVLQEKNINNIHNVVLCEKTLRALKEIYYKKSLTENNDSIVSFSVQNAESTTFHDNSFDLVTIMYAFHEIPKHGRYRILKEIRRVLQKCGTLALIDISPAYRPSKSMLSGEPYVLEYQRNIQSQLENINGFTNLRCEVIVPNHVVMWLLEKEST